MRFAPGLAAAIAAFLTTAAFAQGSGVAVGAFVKDANDPNGIASLEQQLCNQYQVCRVLALDLHAEKWAYTKVTNELADVTAGRTPVIAWAENSSDMPAATDIINGVYDQLLQVQAGYLYNLPNHATVMIEFIPEMTNSSHQWLATFYGTPDWYMNAANIQAAGALYQQAEIHIASIMHTYAPNVKFIFAGETAAYTTNIGVVPEWVLFFPGNATDDFVGADHKTGKADLSSDKYFREFYAQAVTTNLPVMMTQVCSTANAAGYINSAVSELPSLFPAVVSFVYNDTTAGGCDLEGQNGALQAFASMASNSYFQLTF